MKYKAKLKSMKITESQLAIINGHIHWFYSISGVSAILLSMIANDCRPLQGSPTNEQAQKSYASLNPIYQIVSPKL